MFGSALPPQNESTNFTPLSPYAAAKVYSYWMTVTYREAYGIHCVNGILFNHESPRRGETFVTRKVSRAVAKILAGKQDSLYLGNLDAKRDWGYAPEYVEAMWMMLQSDEPQDFAIGTGKNYSVKEFVKTAFEYAGLDYKDFVKLDKRYLRPIEVDELKADPSKAANILGWKPEIYLDGLISIMVDADMESIGMAPIGKGKKLIESNDMDWHKWGGAGEALSKPD
jgi:GDPmannose 4,6-dehydratase